MSKTTLLEKANELSTPRRNFMKTKQELGKANKDTIINYKEIIFDVDRPIFIKYLDELKMKKVINEKKYDKKLIDDAVRKLAWKRLQENTAADDSRLIGKRTGEVLGATLNLEVDYSFISFTTLLVYYFKSICLEDKWCRYLIL